MVLVERGRQADRETYHFGILGSAAIALVVLCVAAGISWYWVCKGRFLQAQCAQLQEQRRLEGTQQHTVGQLMAGVDSLERRLAEAERRMLLEKSDGRGATGGPES